MEYPELSIQIDDLIEQMYAMCKIENEPNERELWECEKEINTLIENMTKNWQNNLFIHKIHTNIAPMNQHKRFELIMDDLRAIKQHLYLNNLGHLLEQPTKHCDELNTHFNNIEIACDLKSDEAETWGRFEDDDTKVCSISGETMTEWD